MRRQYPTDCCPRYAWGDRSHDLDCRFSPGHAERKQAARELKELSKLAGEARGVGASEDGGE